MANQQQWGLSSFAWIHIWPLLFLWKYGRELNMSSTISLSKLHGLSSGAIMSWPSVTCLTVLSADHGPGAFSHLAEYAFCWSWPWCPQWPTLQFFLLTMALVKDVLSVRGVAHSIILLCSVISPGKSRRKEVITKTLIAGLSGLLEDNKDGFDVDWIPGLRTDEWMGRMWVSHSETERAFWIVT